MTAFVDEAEAPGPEESRAALVWREVWTVMPRFVLRAVLGDHRVVSIQQSPTSGLRVEILSTAGGRAERRFDLTGPDDRRLPGLRRLARVRPVVVVPPADRVLARRLTLPHLPRRALDKAVRLNLETWTAFNPDEAFHAVRSTRGSGARTRLRIDVTPVGSVLPLIEACSSLKLPVDAVAFPGRQMSAWMLPRRARRRQMMMTADGLLIGLGVVFAGLYGHSALETASQDLRLQEARLRVTTEAIRDLGDPQSALAALKSALAAAGQRLVGRVSAVESLGAVSSQIEGRATVASVDWSPTAIRVELVASGPVEAPISFGPYTSASSRAASDMPDGRRTTDWIFTALPEAPSR